MRNKEMDKEYWDQRFKEDNTPWDMGQVSPPIQSFIDGLENKNIRILIPGAGNAHEAEYLFGAGFKNVFIVDLSATALNNFSNRVPNFPKGHLICENFFDHQGKYDLIIEQTFFCALDPSLRSKYVLHMSELLAENGSLVGLLFDAEMIDGPPFGGNKKEYKQLFKDLFVIKKMELCHNSIKPRAGKELWIQFLKESTYEKTI